MKRIDLKWMGIIEQVGIRARKIILNQDRSRKRKRRFYYRYKEGLERLGNELLKNVEGVII